MLVAAFATRGLCADVLRTVLAEHQLVIGEVILTEFRRVLARKLRVPEERLRAAEAVFEGLDIVPKPRRPAPVEINDRSDRWIVATAIAGHADVLVTGDAALLSLTVHDRLPIVSPRQFWELLRRGEG